VATNQTNLAIKNEQVESATQNSLTITIIVCSVFGFIIISALLFFVTLFCLGQKAGRRVNLPFRQKTLDLE
jgi:hypothetical protein